MTGAPPAPASACPRAAPVERVARGRRLDALDGVRAVAVSAVLVVHALPTSPFPGAVGVDVFFVLSGYLITTLLLAERDRRGRVDLPLFYARRVLRLAPALLVWLVALYPLGRALVGEDYLPRALVVAQFRANLALTLERSSLTPLEHAWSLGQEAQFYLLWPLLLLGLLLLRVPRPVLVGALVVAAGGSFAALSRLQDAGPAPADDFRPLVRAGGLLLGCALALALRQGWPLLARRGLAEAGLLGLVAVLGAGSWLGLGLEVTVPAAVGATAVLVAGLVAGPGGPAAALLSAPGPVALGRMSYSLYLWHYPFFLAFEERTDLAPALVLLLEVVLALAAAAMSYAVVELPVARWVASGLHASDVVTERTEQPIRS